MSKNPTDSRSSAGRCVYAEELRERMWKTAGARFNAHRRLQAQHTWSLWTIAWLSVVLIAVSVTDLEKSGGNTTGPIPVATLIVICSVGILVLSLLEAGRNAVLQADRLHSCAVEVNRLVGRLGGLISAKDITPAVAEQIRAEYESVIAKYPLNHKPLDYRRFLAQRWKDLGGTLAMANVYRAEWIAVVYGPYILAIVVGTAFGIALIL